ncbi:hypothetical protein Vretimale_17252 [Volvox reticuliferus]|uniref:Uncharacterized protein n=1 Tax=Volvox reticuliferus TaxID=1737510 RepID=A0A8J4GUM2_9CHLO|nr:hypothetical protein Vretimale_17252 [Volvox reticuliferus]
MGGVKAAKVGFKASSKPSVIDGNGVPSSSPRVVSEELMALLRRGNASAVKRYLKSGADVNQVLHVPQLDKPWGYAAPSAAAAAAVTAAPATPAGTASENKEPGLDGRKGATGPAAGAEAAAPAPAPPLSGHWPLILLACAISSAGVVEVLLKAGADPNARNVYGLTALVAAVYNDGLTATEKLALVKLLQRHGFSLFGASCEALGERATAVTALLHQLAMGEPEARDAAVPLVDWLLQHEPLPQPPDSPLFQHLCFSLALEPAALLTWLPLLQRRTTYVPGSPAYAELVVGVVAAAHQLRDARAAAAAQAMAAAPPAIAAPALPSPSTATPSTVGGRFHGSVADGELGSLGYEACSAQQRQQQSCGKPGLELSLHGPQVPAKKKREAACSGGGSGSVSGGHVSDLGNGSAAAAVVNGGGTKASGSSSGAALRPAAAPTHRTEGGLLAARERERSRRGARARVAARAAAAASVAAAAANAAVGDDDDENPAGLLLRGSGGEEALVLRAFLECGLNPNMPMCADGLLPMQRFLEKPELLGVLLEGGMDPRVRAGVPPLDLTFLHSYALIGRFQSSSEVAVQACAVLLSRDPGLLWLRCAGLTAFQLALAHANLGMVEYLAPLMGSEQQEAAVALRQRMLGGPAKCCSISIDGLDNDGMIGKSSSATNGEISEQDDNIAARVWDPTSPAAAAAAVAAAAAASPVLVAGQDSEVVSSYRLLYLALQRPELWGNDMSGLMRQVPLMDIRQILTLLDVLNSSNLFNVVAFLEHCRTFAQRVILQVLQLGAEGHELMQAAAAAAAAAPEAAAAAAPTQPLHLSSDNAELAAAVADGPAVADAPTAAEPAGRTCAPVTLPASPSGPPTRPPISPSSPSPPCSTRSSSAAITDAPDASITVTITSSSSSSGSSGSSGSCSSSEEQGSGGSTTSSGCCSPARAASPPPPLATAAAAVPAAAEAVLSSPLECGCVPPELAYLEDVVVEQTELLQSLYALMAVCSLCSHLLCPDFGLAMCSREFRTRMTGIPDATIDRLAERHGGAAATNAAAGSTGTPAPAAPASSAAAATAAALLSAYPRSGQLSLDQLYAQLLGSMSPAGADQKELVESRKEFLKQVLAMDSMWRAMQQRQQQEARREGRSAAEQTIKADGTPDTTTAETAAGVPEAPLPPRRELRNPALVAEARQAVLSHPVLWTVVREVAALPSAPGPRPGLRVLWDDDNTPIYVLMSLAARRAVDTAYGMHPQPQPAQQLQQ